MLFRSEDNRRFGASLLECHCGELVPHLRNQRRIRKEMGPLAMDQMIIVDHGVQAQGQGPDAQDVDGVTDGLRIPVDCRSRTLASREATAVWLNARATSRSRAAARTLPLLTDAVVRRANIFGCLPCSTGILASCSVIGAQAPRLPLSASGWLCRGWCCGVHFSVG